MPQQVRKGPKALQDGVRACRKGDWRNGLNILSQLAQEIEGETVLPGYFYSYLGVAMVRIEGRRHEGIELCRYGVKLAPSDPQNRLNLAMAYMINHNRRRAVRQIEIGLSKHPGHKALRDFQEEIGKRRKPIIPVLGRDNPINIWLGRATHNARKAREARDEEMQREEEIERLAGREPSGLQGRPQESVRRRK